MTTFRRFWQAWLYGIGICVHPVELQILRRKDGVMGFECMACGQWVSAQRELSKAAKEMAARQEARRLADAENREKSKVQRGGRKRKGSLVILEKRNEKLSG